MNVIALTLLFLCLGGGLSTLADYARDHYVVTGSRLWRTAHTVAFCSLGIVGFVYGYAISGIAQ